MKTQELKTGTRSRTKSFDINIDNPLKTIREMIFRGVETLYDIFVDKGCLHRRSNVDSALIYQGIQKSDINV